MAIASSHAMQTIKAQHGAVRIDKTDALAAYLNSYEDGENDALAADLRSQISEVPNGTVLVAGVISIGCDIPGSATLVRIGDKIGLQADLLPTEPTPECVVANMTIAIVAADYEDLPTGSTSFGTLTSFDTVNSASSDGVFPLELTASDTEFLAALQGLNIAAPALPEVAPGDRRFAFLLTGCTNDGAELQVTDTTISATLTFDEAPEIITLCEAPENYLAIIDVAADQIPSEATLSVEHTYATVDFQLLKSRSFGGPQALEITDDPGLIAQTWEIQAQLPELGPDTRRFAFLLYGCQDDWAELKVQPTRIYAVLGNDRPANEQIDCAVADVYLAVFDVPAAEIPATATLPAE